MKSLRIIALMLAVSAFPVLTMQAYGQQEMDPDHFDQASTAQASTQGPKAKNEHSAKSAKHDQRGTKLASKQLGSKGNPRHSRVAS